MGIFTWLVRAPETEMYTHLTSKGRTIEDANAFVNDEAIKTFDSALRTPPTDEFYHDENSQATEKEEEEEGKKPAKKKARLEEDEEWHKHERRHDMDKSWDELHVQLCNHYGVEGPEESRTGGGFCGRAPKYEQHSVSYFMTDTRKGHNKFYMVTLTSSGQCRIQYGPIIDLPKQLSRTEKRLSGGYGGLDECTHTIAAKLKRGYKCQAIGVTTSLIEKCVVSGAKFSLLDHVNDTTSSNNRHERVDPSQQDKKTAQRVSCGGDVPDFINYRQTKDSGVKKILATAGATNTTHRDNAAGRTISLFETMCEEFCFTPRRKGGGHLSIPDYAPLIVEGGEPTPFEMGYGNPGRVLSPRLVKAWDRFLKNIDTEEFALKCGEMNRDDYKYHKLHIRSLRYFVHLSARRDEAIFIYIA